MSRTRRSPVLPLIFTALVLRIRGGMSDDRERGDVPGWVMITLMSAVLVAGLIAIVQPALRDLFNSAIAQVQP